MGNNNQQSDRKAALEMLRRMHNDAAAMWVPIADALTGQVRLAFDHAEIVTAAWAHLHRTGWWAA